MALAMADRLAGLLPEETAGLLLRYRDELTELRLRAGRPAQLTGLRGEHMAGESLAPAALLEMLSALMDYSVYARQDELDEGFFTLDDGSRVGVCGRMVMDGERLRMAEIGSACVRVARALPGCADGLIDVLMGPDGLRSTLLLSPPGLGKTTLLRDIARQLSDTGACVAIADERHELAACRKGVPTLDVGMRTDVMDGCPRPEAMRRMLRAMAPQIIVADEVGGESDARALAEAARCGVAVAASAHAAGLGDALARRSLRALLSGDVFQTVVLLGPAPGAIRRVWRRQCAGEGEAAWKPA